MKVAYIGRDISKGGANLLPILECLPDGVEWKLFCSKSDLGATLLFLKHRRELSSFDVIHVNCSLYGALTCGINKPIVCSVHTIQKTECKFDPTFRNRLGIFFESLTIKNTSKFLVVSQFIADDLLRQYPDVDKNDVEVLPHVAVDSDPFISFKKEKSCGVITPDTETVLASGRLVKRKNFGLLVECAKKCPNIAFILVGEGPEFEWLKNVNLPNLRVTNYLTRKDYIHLLSNSFAYVLTSQYEGYPTVVFEAMACGIPVLSLRIPSVEEMIVDGETGLFFSGVEEFAEKLRLIQDSELYHEIRKNARAHVESMPTKKEIASKFVEVYEELM